MGQKESGAAVYQYPLRSDRGDRFGIGARTVPDIFLDFSDEAAEIGRDFCFQLHPPAVPGM